MPSDVGSRLREAMESGAGPPAFLGMIANVGEEPFVQTVAVTPEAAEELRAWLLLPETAAAIAAAIADELDRLARTADN